MEVSEVLQPTLDGAVLIQLQVTPGARRQGLTGLDPWRKALNLAVRAQPREGRANKAVIEVIAEILGASKQQVTLISGEGSHQKRVRVDEMTPAAAIERITAHLPPEAEPEPTVVDPIDALFDAPEPEDFTTTRRRTTAPHPPTTPHPSTRVAPRPTRSGGPTSDPSEGEP